jgi:hypothetical protein
MCYRGRAAASHSQVFGPQKQNSRGRIGYGFVMNETAADQYRAAGIWPARPMTASEPLPAPRPRRSRARAAFEIAGKVIVVLVFLSSVAYVLARASGQIYMLVRAMGI